MTAQLATPLEEIDAFLQNQDRVLATLEADSSNVEVVRIMPWVGPGICSCGAKLTVPKKHINSVAPTGMIHSCCGKHFRVAYLTLTDSAVIPTQTALRALFFAFRDGTSGGGTSGGGTGGGGGGAGTSGGGGGGGGTSGGGTSGGGTSAGGGSGRSGG